MLKELYTAALGMIPRQTRLELVANNIANANTTGFKRESAFESSLIEARENMNNVKGDAEMDDTPTYSFTDFRQGAYVRTGNPFDIAVDSKDGFFVVADESGKEFFTRSGHFTLGHDGTIQTPDGMQLIGDNGPFVVQQFMSGQDFFNDTRTITVRVDESGEVFANEQAIGRVVLVDVTNPQTLKRESGAHFSATDQTEYQPFAADRVRVRQGYLEGANVDVVKEMVEMIELQRYFELGQKVISTNDSTLDRTIDIGRFQ